MYFLKHIYILFFVCISLGKLYANNLEIPLIEEHVEFSSEIVDNVWDLAMPLTMVMHSPNFGNNPSENTQVRIGYSTNFLWVFARLYYSSPDDIVSTSKSRDEESKNSDAFGIIIDSYNDNENAMAFFTSPSGQRIDYTIANDANFESSVLSKSTVNNSWNSFWDVETQIAGNCWQVVMRIPFSSLRFQEVNGKVQMGIILNRVISKSNELNTFPEIDPKYGIYAPLKPSLAKTIEINGIKSVKPLYIAPYALAGYGQTHKLNTAGNEYNLKEEKKLTGGLDIKYSLNSNLTMDLTVNTDFAQVEADDELVNITRYSLYLPEKRMFFQERASIFKFDLGTSQELFYSRNIGLHNGVPVPILGGVRLNGRMGKWDMGLLNMQTGIYDTLPMENFGVVRTRRQVFNSNSYVGAMATSRITFNGNKSYAYGADGIFRLFGDDYFETHLAQSTGNSGELSSQVFENSFTSLRWQRRTEKGFAYDMKYTYSGKLFNPSLGFMTKIGVSGIEARTQYGWFFGENSSLINFKWFAKYSENQNLFTKSLENMFGYTGFSFLTKSGWSALLDLFYFKDKLTFDFHLSDEVYIPQGIYGYKSVFSMISSPFSKPVNVSLTLSGGEYYDGNRISINAETVFNISSSLKITGAYSYNHIVFPSREMVFNSHVSRVKAVYMYNTKLSLSAFIQYNSTSQLFSGNFRLRFNPKEGNDFYIVYNEIKPGASYNFDFVDRVVYFNRFLLTKYVYTFKL